MALSATVELPEDLDKYEQVWLLCDEMHAKSGAAIECIVKFIIDNKFILYGGTAIDMALRLKGSFLYADDIQHEHDYDFYSPTSIQHAYQLTDLLYDIGYSGARALAGVHMTTQRVDIGDNHFIADVSYVPVQTYDKMPYLEYLGMRFIHPWYQLIDLHSAMSFLYDEAPRENIFNRLLKDMKRSDMLLKAYPIVSEPFVITPWPTQRVNLRRFIISGELAYAFYYRLCPNKTPEMIPVTFSIDEHDNIIYAGRIELVDHNVEKVVSRLDLSTGKYYKKLFNLQPMRYVDTNYTIFSTKNRLLSIHSTYVDGRPFRLVCFQYLLRHFIATYYETSNPLYLAYYNSCLRMIPEDPRGTPYYISTEYYGSENKSIAYLRNIAAIDAEIKKTPVMLTPSSYAPGRLVERGLERKWPTIDIGTMHDFDMDGTEITN